VRRSPLSPTEMLSTSFWTLISRIGFACFFSDACNRRNQNQNQPTSSEPHAREGRTIRWGKKGRGQRYEQRARAHHWKIWEATARGVRWFCSAVRGGGGGGRGSFICRQRNPKSPHAVCNYVLSPEQCSEWRGVFVISCNELAKKFPLPGLEPGSLG
jgi:hypothetical protein